MIVALNDPRAPFVPQEHHFAPGVALMIVGFSTAAAHATLLTSAKEALAPLFEFRTDLPYTALQAMLDDSSPYGVAHAYNKALFLDELGDAAIDDLAEWLPAKSSPLSLLPIFPLGGAYTDVDDDATALGGRRSSRFAVNMNTVALDPDGLVTDRAWVRSMWEALLPFAADGGSYVNFMTDYEPDRVRAAYGPTKYERLARIKAVYDPRNVFDGNATSSRTHGRSAPEDPRRCPPTGGLGAPALNLSET